MNKYLATAHYVHADISCETWEMDELMKFLCEHEKAHTDVINAHTGEVLYVANHPQSRDYLEKEFMYTVTGWMAFQEATPEPDPREQFVKDILEVCEEFSATLTIP